MINILSKDIRLKIAAGEVIERPASIVKELLENSIDAKASFIKLQVFKGCDNIIVTDNGIGMNKEDLNKSILEYATSKISKISDIYNIKTLGFRGEALASIGAISDLEIITKEKNGRGYILKKINGKYISEEYPANQGTIVKSLNIFYNFPARKKFLRSTITELSYIRDVLINILLSNFQLKVEFLSEKKSKIFMPAHNLLDRIKGIYGNEIADNLIPVEKIVDEIELTGYISKPGFTRKNNKLIKVFLNGRAVVVPFINYIIRESYSRLLMKHGWPAVFLFINISPQLVDVNVHPSKKEVKFIKQSSVYNFILQAINESFKNTSIITNVVKFHSEHGSYGRKSAEIKDFEHLYKKSNPVIEIAQTHNEEINLLEFEPSNAINDGCQNTSEYFNIKARDQNYRFVYRGSLFNTYIILEENDDIFIIDQHAAHERIRLENLNNSNTGSMQNLLFPYEFRLEFSELPFIDKIIDYFLSININVSQISENIFTIDSIPEIIKEEDIKDIIDSLIERIKNDIIEKKHNNKAINKIIENINIDIACKGAIKAGDLLTIPEIKELVRQLFQCEHYSVCAHGRPTIKIFNKYDIEKIFKRK